MAAGCAVSDCNQKMIDHSEKHWERNCKTWSALGATCNHSTAATLATNLQACACAYASNPSKYSGSLTGTPRDNLAALCTYSECHDYIADMVAIFKDMPKNKQNTLLVTGLSECAGAGGGAGGGIAAAVVVLLLVGVGVGVVYVKKKKQDPTLTISQFGSQLIDGAKALIPKKKKAVAPGGLREVGQDSSPTVFAPPVVKVQNQTAADVTDVPQTELTATAVSDVP